MSAFLTAHWQNLVMANYRVDPEILKPYLPIHTELDYYDGHAYASLVGFLFADTRLKGMKIPFHVNFEEVNLRFYVRHHDGKEWKRGVVFIKEIVPRAAITWVANTIYHEKYATHLMKHSFSFDEDHLSLEYAWKHAGSWNSLKALVRPASVPMLPGSEEEFIAEHYWGYSRYDADTTYEYEVTLPAWEVYPLLQYDIQCDFGTLYGPAFAALQQAVPHSVFVAKGSPVAVLPKRKL